MLGEVAEQYKNRVTNRSQKWGVPVLEPPDARRDNFMGAYFKQAKADQIVAIFKAREPGRLLIANGNRATSTSTMPAGAVCSSARVRTSPSPRGVCLNQLRHSDA